MASWTDTLTKLAPTVASAILGPLGGIALSAIGNIIGIDGATQDTIKAAIEDGRLTPEHIAELKKLEMSYIENEKERGFKYAELSFKDRASARESNVAGGVQNQLFWLSLLLLAVTLGSEVAVLFFGYPSTIDDIVVGRVLGLLDSVALLVLSYWFGSSSGSNDKTTLLAKAQPVVK